MMEPNNETINSNDSGRFLSVVIPAMVIKNKGKVVNENGDFSF